MPYYEFSKEDVFHNTVETHPTVQFDINDSHVYLANVNQISGAFTSNIGHVPVGNVSLYELNVDRPSDSLIYPFVTKGGSFEAIGNVSVKDYFSTFEYGDVISGSFPLSASLSREHFAAGHGTSAPTGSHLLALRNTLNYYTPLSPSYAFSSSAHNIDKSQQELSLLYIPSIFYGSNIEKGSVDLRFYISGTLVAQASDIGLNGELRQVSGSAYSWPGQTKNTGSVAGVVLYNEGVICLTGSWNLTEDSYDRGDDTGPFRWIDFAAGANDGTSDTSPSASFSLNFKGRTDIQTVTMFATAPRSDMNFSTNHTYLDYDTYQSGALVTSSYQYKESENMQIFNTVSSSFYRYEDSFKYQTFINKIGIYDKNLKLIAVANLATPIKKTNARDYTFKLKLDI